MDGHLPKHENDGDESSYSCSSLADHGVDAIGEGSARPQKEELAATENRRVFLSRLAVLVVLTLSAVCISLGVYFYLAAAERNKFVNQFRSDALKVMESVGDALDHTLGSADAFATKKIAYARDSNSSWPLVTLPHYAVQATKLLRLSKAYLVRTMMVVYPEQRDAWEEYAFNNHKRWVEESLDIQEKDRDYHGPISREYGASYRIYGDGREPKDKAEPLYNAFLPDWQRSPVIPGDNESSVYNFDGLTFQYAAITRWRAKTTKRAVISEYNNDHGDWVSKFIPPDEDPFEPISALAYPMIDSMETLAFDSDVANDDTKPVVALLSFNFRWVELIRNILPHNSRGIILVFHQSDCGEPFTYQLNGPEAVFMGMGDRHDGRYNYMGKHGKLAELMGVTLVSDQDSPDSGGTASYTGLPLDDEYCSKSVSVYPSATMEDSFTTSNPMVLAVAAALIFVFTSVVFVTYDLLVAKRQRVVMQEVIASGAIVESLYPQNVTKALYHEHEQEQQQNARQSKFLAAKVMQQSSCEPTPGSSDAIAEHYENTTVILADLSGFSDWSKNRTPKQVFELLETLYGAFDSIAAKRAVLKIETIGDCYVAVAGIPDAQRDHAVRIVRFARSIMNEMDRITHTLQEQFGDDTKFLQLRVGVNSGDVTAGVLRGSKQRFQLFGDTVNTASRMQSHGAPGCIHASEATAKELIKAGKQHWVTPRADKIKAKGKGELQSFWINVRGGSTASFATTQRSTSASVITQEDADELQAQTSQRALVPLDEGDEFEENDGDNDCDGMDELEDRLFQRLEC